MLAALALAILTGCPAKQNVQCVESSNCDLATGGQCLSTASGNQWCAYPDPNCPSGFRYSDLDVGDGLSGECTQASNDAGVDAAPLIDATPGQNRFDVAYVDEWRLGTSTTVMNVTAFLRIANLGAQPLDVSTMTITNVTDDHPNMVVNITIDNAGTTSLPPGFSDGDLTSAAGDLVRPKMSESALQPTMSLLRINVDPVSPSGTWFFVAASATLTIGNAYAIIPITLTSSGTGSASTPYTARRVSSMNL